MKIEVDSVMNLTTISYRGISCSVSNEFHADLRKIHNLSIEVIIKDLVDSHFSHNTSNPKVAIVDKSHTIDSLDMIFIVIGSIKDKNMTITVNKKAVSNIYEITSKHASGSIEGKSCWNV